MAERLSIKLTDIDNVAVAVHDLPAGTTIESGVTTLDPIPQAHKIALVDIPATGKIIRYGVVLGYAKKDIPAGSWINEHMLDLPESPSVENLEYGTNIKKMEDLPEPPRKTWMGYCNKTGPVGTRNLLGIVPTVQCAAGVLKVAVECIAKSGTNPIVEVLSPAQKPTKHGLIYAATPASDIVCGPSQVASGIGLQVFMTDRGTPYGLDISPVIKVCSRNETKEHWFDMIHISAGAVAMGEATIAEVGTEIFHFILDVASGVKAPYSDQYGFHNDM